MAHATHQFFLRSKCLYVVVLAGRAERNPNEEAEYWLEHVRAFGDSAPVLIVGNKAEVMPVNLDLKTLKDKYPNIVDYYSISCTQAKDAFRESLKYFAKSSMSISKSLVSRSERFSPPQLKVLKTIEEKAGKGRFSSTEQTSTNLPDERHRDGRSGRARWPARHFDKLGIVMHFARLPFFTDYVLNPRWLTYGVYTIMYSEEAKAAKGRLGESDLVAILKKANPSISNGHAFCIIRRNAAKSSPMP